jgi:YidC/Oxa1 family membrane protein insertase
MLQLFDSLIRLLGTTLSFFFDLLVPPMGPGVGWGLSIIFLTILINVVVFPLTLKQTRATRAFSQIQPKIKKIQAEYKDDPQEMQRQLMAAQKEAGATPGGCLLPLLVQMPIWFALFRLLGNPLAYLDGDSGVAQAVADGTSRFLGMNLVTTPSEAFSTGLLYALPYLGLILIMVVTQYVQQWHATYGQVKNADQKGAAAQQAITKILPLFIGLISWNFPAGLVLYWSTGNLFRFGQQALIFKIDGRPTIPTEEVPAKAVEGDGEGEKKPQPKAVDKRKRRRRS